MKWSDERGDWQEYAVKVRYLPGTSIVVEENWYVAGTDERGRNHGPAVLEWDPDTLNLIREEHWRACLHSPRSGEIPAITEYDPVTSDPTKRVWMKHHKKHRLNNLPAIEFLKDGLAVRHEYWINGELKRQDGGPPIVNFDPAAGEITSTADALEPDRQAIPIPKPSDFSPS